MPVQVKRSGGYADVAAVFVKRTGAYAAVAGVYAKSGGAYGRVDAAPVRRISIGAIQRPA